eukprot:gene6951-9506_t
MSHGVDKRSAIVMRNADGTPMSRDEVIIKRRGAFKWLPPFCSNDLVHGSWWFVAGSFLTVIFSIIPLITKYIGFVSTDDTLPAVDHDATWAMLIVSGIFFTIGSYGFVRAFEEPPKRALFYYNRHFQTDELLGAWCFLFGTLPAVPYCVVFFSITPGLFYFVATIGSSVFVIGSILFVVSCYPNDKKQENYLLPLCLRAFGAQMWIVKHLANDWLAGTWFFLWANGLLTFISFIMLFIALGLSNAKQVFVWMSGSISSFAFLVGSFYFTAGSYPHANQFYYSIGRGKSSAPTGATAEEDIEIDEEKPSKQDVGLGLLPSFSKNRPIKLYNRDPATQTTGNDSDVVNPFHANLSSVSSISNSGSFNTSQPMMFAVKPVSMELRGADTLNPMFAPVASSAINPVIINPSLQTPVNPTVFTPPHMKRKSSVKKSPDFEEDNRDDDDDEV